MGNEIIKNICGAEDNDEIVASGKVVRVFMYEADVRWVALVSCLSLDS